MSKISIFFAKVNFVWILPALHEMDQTIQKPFLVCCCGCFHRAIRNSSDFQWQRSWKNVVVRYLCLHRNNCFRCCFPCSELLLRYGKIHRSWRISTQQHADACNASWKISSATWMRSFWQILCKKMFFGFQIFVKLVIRKKFLISQKSNILTK